MKAANLKYLLSLLFSVRAPEENWPVHHSQKSKMTRVLQCVKSSQPKVTYQGRNVRKWFKNKKSGQATL